MHSSTIKDVAKMAGVSTATVSYVLNGTQKITESTREKVLAAAQTLGYTPNVLARGLVGKATKTIAVAVAPDFCGTSSDAGVFGVLKGIGESAYTADYSLMLLFPETVAQVLLSELAAKGVEGLLLVGFHLDPKVIAAAPYPIIMANFSYSATAETDSGVYFSYFEAFVVALKHFADLGRQRVFLLGPSLPNPDHLATEVQNLVGQDTVTLQYLAAEPTAAGGYMAIDQLVPQAGIDGIITFNDSMAVGVMHALARKGISVPEEIGVIGCTDDLAASYSDPPLTTVRLPWSMLGKALVNRFLGEQIQTIIKPKLVIRESCGSVLWI